MDYLPAPELRKILLPSYMPCEGFNNTCKGVAKWNPQGGDVPRGFIGATSGLDEVEVVILIAEPGRAYESDPFLAETSRKKYLEQACKYTYKHFDESHGQFHKNMRSLLSLIFPNMGFEQQLRKVWITETFLCSAPVETGNVPIKAENGCAQRYLAAQLNLLKGRPVIALGGKAQKRVESLKSWVPDLSTRLIKAYSIAPPGANHHPARPSWEAAAVMVRAMIDSRHYRQDNDNIL